MKRRKALKYVGLGLSGSLVLPQILTSCGKDDPGPEIPYDGNVVVIGAGAAGLYAADILNAKGIKVSILEAANQMGGRVRSLRNQPDLVNISAADFPVELGCEVIYGSDSIMGTSLKNFNIAISELTGSDQFIMDNIAKPEDEWSVDGDFVNSQNFVNNIPNYSGPAVTVQQAASGQSPRVTNLLNSQVGNRYGSSNEVVGIKGVAEAMNLIQHDGMPMLLRTNPVQDFLIFRFDAVRDKVKLNTPVTAINYSGDVITITDANGGETTATKVIVTVPLSILKKGGISFSPGLPSAMNSAMTRLAMDPCIRVVIDFKKNFWGEATRFIWGGSSFPDCLNTGYGRSEFNQTLSITINGAKAEELSAQGPDMINTILSELDLIYNGQATQFVRRDLNTNEVLSIIQDWGKEEFIQGGFSYPTSAATMADREALSQVVGNKLFFAGEASDLSGTAGTINGALASAERAALQVIDAITG